MGKAPTILSSQTVNQVTRIISDLENRFNIVSASEFGSLVNYTSQANEPINRWFRYREGYSANLVSELLRDIPLGSLVVDPFCGAGTTLLVARNNGYPSIGLDANPLSTFISKVKTEVYSVQQLSRFVETVNRLNRLSIDSPSSPLPNFRIIDKVFAPSILQSLLVIRHYIDTELPISDRNFFFLAWLSILERVSNVYKEGNGLKYRNRKRTPGGYIEIPLNDWIQSNFPTDTHKYVLKEFTSQVLSMIEDAHLFTEAAESVDVYEGDALNLEDFVQQGQASLVVFSPPYANNFNYFKAYKVELWMGGFVSTNDDMHELNRRALRSHVETQLHKPSDSQNWYPEELDSLLNLMPKEALWTAKIPDSVRGYFYDMHTAIKGAFDSLTDDGRCVIVVGNSAYGSIPVPTDILLAEIANTVGFQVEKIAVARHLTTSSQQKQALEPLKHYLRESLVILQRPKKYKRRSLTTKSDGLQQRFVAEIPKFPRDSEHLVYVLQNRNLTQLTHKIHKYPSKFIPHIPRWAIKKFIGHKENQVVLDPFCGSGTTLVEAQLEGHNAYGIDVDPLARLISKVKTTALNELTLSVAIEDTIHRIQSSKVIPFKPDLAQLDHWFTPEIAIKLGTLRAVIDDWKQRDRDIYDFLLICFSSIIRKSSNADNQSLKTYVSGTLKKRLVDPIPLFLKTLREYAEAVILFGKKSQPGGKTRVLTINDSRDFASYWSSAHLPLVDLGITSPPYIKSIDIIYNQMAEYFWIGDLFGLETQAKQNIAKRQYIGTEKVNVSEYKDSLTTNLAAVDNISQQVSLLNPKHGFITSRYFQDMKMHFEQMSQVLKTDAYYVMVVGDSTINDISIPTHELISDVAASQGFKLRETFAYEIRNRYMRFPRQGRGGIVDLDWVLTFQLSGKV